MGSKKMDWRPDVRALVFYTESQLYDGFVMPD